MIVYGWNTKNIKQAPLDNYECPNCQQKESVLVIFARYIHIFWIPVFPIKKAAIIVCNQCKHETDEKAINLGTQSTIKQLKATVPVPKYLFSGLVLILAAIGYFIYDGMQTDKLEQAYLDAPQQGDVYLIKNNDEPSEYNHYLLKVRETNGDSVWVSSSAFSYNGIVSELDPKDGFYDVMYAMHKNDIQEIKKAGDLKKVMRDYLPTAGFDREIEFQKSDTLVVE
jgi:hypothetical protein